MRRVGGSEDRTIAVISIASPCMPPDIFIQNDELREVLNPSHNMSDSGQRPRPPPNRRRDKVQLSCDPCRNRKYVFQWLLHSGARLTLPG